MVPYLDKLGLFPLEQIAKTHFKNVIYIRIILTYALPKEKLYEVRVPLTINVDNDTLKKFREMCHRDHTSMSQRLDEFMKDEVKKVEGLATPIAITYTHNANGGQSYNQQTLISSFADFDTVPNCYKKAQLERPTRSEALKIVSKAGCVVKGVQCYISDLDREEHLIRKKIVV